MRKKNLILSLKCSLFLLCLFLCENYAGAQVRKIAVLETVDREGNVPYAVKVMVRSNLTKAITNTYGYEAYDRIDVSQIMGEQSFQRSGMVSDEQIKRLGEMAGAEFILIAEAVTFDPTSVFITAKVLNVETAKTELSENSLMAMTATDIQHGCESLAKKLLKVENVSRTSSSVLASTVPASPNRVQASVPEVKSSPGQSEIGGVYTFPDGSKGIIFYKTADGHGLVVSFDEGSNLKWDKHRRPQDLESVENEKDDDVEYNVYHFNSSCCCGEARTNFILSELSEDGEAAYWCQSLGEGWYCPSATELLYLMKIANKNGEIDEVLKSKGVNSLSGWYWSSSEYNRGEAWNVSSRGRLCSEDKDEKINVRAVRAF